MRLQEQPALHDIETGDYLCSERDLYRVEHAGSNWAVVENCRDGGLIHMPTSELVGLGRVSPATA